MLNRLLFDDVVMLLQEMDFVYVNVLGSRLCSKDDDVTNTLQQNFQQENGRKERKQTRLNIPQPKGIVTFVYLFVLKKNRRLDLDQVKSYFFHTDTLLVVVVKNANDERRSSPLYTPTPHPGPHPLRLPCLNLPEQQPQPRKAPAQHHPA